MQGATTVACGRLLGGSDQLPECWSSTWPALSQKGLGVGTGPGGDAGISVRVQQGLHGCGGQPTHPSAQGWCVPSSHPALLSSGLGPHAAAAVLVTLMGVGSDVQESLPWQQLTHSTLRGGTHYLLLVPVLVDVCGKEEVAGVATEPASTRHRLAVF